MGTLQRIQIGASLCGYVASTAGAICTNASGKITLVAGLTVHNTNSTTETVQVYLVPNVANAVGTAGTANRLFTIALAANDSFTWEPPYGVTMTGTNDTIQAVTTTASKVTYTVHGDQIA